MTGMRLNKRKVLYVPEDWFAVAPTRYLRDAVIHFGVSRGTIQQLELQTGITCRRQQRKEPDQSLTYRRPKTSALREAGIEPELYRMAMGAWHR